MASYLVMLISLPFAAALLSLLFPKKGDGGQRQLAIIVTVFQLLLALFCAYHIYKGTLPVSTEFDLSFLGTRLSHFTFSLTGSNVFVLVCSSVLAVIAVLLTPRDLPDLHIYYSLLLFGFWALILPLFFADRLLFVAMMAVGTLPQFVIATRWGRAGRQQKNIRKMSFLQFAAFLCLLLGYFEGHHSPVFLLIGCLLLLPLYPIPRWLKIWQQSPSSLVFLHLLQGLVCLNFLAQVLTSSGEQFLAYKHYPQLVVAILGALAAILAIRQTDLRHIADSILCAMTGSAVTMLLTSGDGGFVGGLIMYFSCSLSYIILHWLLQVMAANGVPMEVMRCQGMAGPVPESCHLYEAIAASFTLLPVYAPLWAFVRGVAAIEDTPVMADYYYCFLSLFLVTVFFVAVAIIRGVLRLCCGTPSVNMATDVTDINLKTRCKGWLCWLLLVFIGMGYCWYVLSSGVVK